MTADFGQTFQGLVLNNPFEDKSFMQQWQQLYESSRLHTLYQSPLWHKLWWKNFADKSMNLQFYALMSSDGRLLALAPFYLRSTRGPLFAHSSLHFIGASNYASDYCMFLCEQEPATATSGILLKRLLQFIFSDQSWDSLCLFNVPLDPQQKSELYDELDKHSLGRCFIRHLYAAPTFVAKNLTDFKTLRNKKSMKRALNKVSRLGTSNFYRIMNLQEARSLLPQFFEQHRGRRALVNDASQFDDRAQQDFYRDIIDSLNLDQELHFSVLKVNEQAIAFHLGFISQGRFIWYKPSFDASLASYSPGKVLIGNLLEEAARLNLQEFDFTVGNEPFKFQFSNGKREVYELSVVRDNLVYLSVRLKRCLRTVFDSIRALYKNLA